MTLLLEQLSASSKNLSFKVQTEDVSCFTKEMHQHTEIEIVYIKNGSGVAYIGKYESSYDAGDIYLIGSNLPHTFKTNFIRSTNATIIQFRENCMGSYFFNIPECTKIKQLLKMAKNGIQLIGNIRYKLKALIEKLETENNINRIITLLQCLELISTTSDYKLLTNKDTIKLFNEKNIAIEKVLEFTRTRFYSHISLFQAANIACMSISSFCFHFKLCTGKTYINYLNEVRLAHACRQLLETKIPVTEICYESGFNTIVHFHRQFVKLKKITPLQYRKMTSMTISNMNINL